MSLRSRTNDLHPSFDLLTWQTIVRQKCFSKREFSRGLCGAPVLDVAGGTVVLSLNFNRNFLKSMPRHEVSNWNGQKFKSSSKQPTMWVCQGVLRANGQMEEGQGRRAGAQFAARESSHLEGVGVVESHGLCTGWASAEMHNANQGAPSTNFCFLGECWQGSCNLTLVPALL